LRPERFGSRPPRNLQSLPTETQPDVAITETSQVRRLQTSAALPPLQKENPVMSRKFSAGLGAVGTVAFALITAQPLVTARSQTAAPPDQQTPRTSSPSTRTPAPSTQTTRPSGDQVTVTGCIQREADYRRSRGGGQGGVAGTGAGVGNEFVLANAMMSQGGANTGATGTAGSTSNTAYELTGPNEGRAATFVGKRVEITGTLKPTDTAPAGGATANVPGSRDLKLRELEIADIKEATGTCPAAGSTATPRTPAP
jgi:hypothetical protein